MTPSEQDDYEDIRGAVIDGYEEYSDGVHINLQDGRILIIVGRIKESYVGRLEFSTIQ